MTARRRRNPLREFEYDLHGHSADQAEDRLYRILARHQGQDGVVLAIIHGVGEGVLAAVVERIAQRDVRIATADRDLRNQGVTRLRLNAKKTAVRSLPRRDSDDDDAPPIRRRKRR